VECVLIWYGVLHIKLFQKFDFVDISTAYVVQAVLEFCKLRNGDRITNFIINRFYTNYERNWKSPVETFPEMFQNTSPVEGDV
jgi:hypothetical protein